MNRALAMAVARLMAVASTTTRVSGYASWPDKHRVYYLYFLALSPLFRFLVIIGLQMKVLEDAPHRIRLKRPSIGGMDFPTKPKVSERTA